MGFTLQDIKAAMAPIADVGKGELDFEVNGLRLVLRALTPDEEIAVQKYAKEVFADGAEVTDQTTMLEYLDRFRWASLGYSLIQIGDNDFRDVNTIETGDKLSSGQPIKMRRHEAFRDLVMTWARPMQSAVFRKFGELMERVEREVEGLVEFDPVDFDAEIARLEDRLRDLREEKLRFEAGENDPRTTDREKATGRGLKAPQKTGTGPSIEEQTSTNQEALTVAVPTDVEREVVFEDEEQEEAPTALAPSATAGRTPVFARPDVKLPPPAPAVPVISPVQVQEEVYEETPGEAPQGGLDDVMSSMVDTSDPEQMEAAMAAEAVRINAMRARAATRRVPPHQSAREAAAALSEPTAPTLVGKMQDGKEVYKMPTQNLTDRRPPDATPQQPPRSNSNPRFKPPTR